MNKIKIFLLGLVFPLLAMTWSDEWEESKARGAEYYQDYCITCHMGQGEGVEGVFPPLAGSDYLMEDFERAIRIVKYGQQGEIVVNGITYNNVMTPLGLDDDEVADLMNFILSSWGNEADRMITVEEVTNIQQE